MEKLEMQEADQGSIGLFNVMWAQQEMGYMDFP